MNKPNTMRMKGRTVRDATKPLSTTITAEDNDKAVPTDPTQCAIAQSARRAKGVTQISVGANMAYVIFAREPNVIIRYAIPAKERALIRAFDGTGVFPCPWPVKLLPPTIRKLGSRAGRSPGSDKRSGNGSNALHKAGRKPTRHVASPA